MKFQSKLSSKIFKFSILTTNLLLFFPKHSDDGVEVVQSYTFDFFNYAGIHRSVYLYTTPDSYIEDVIVKTDLVETHGHIYYEVLHNSNYTDGFKVRVQILDKKGTVVGNDESGPDCKGLVIIQNVNPWWPYLMDPNPGYLYTMEVYLSTAYEENVDVYRLKVGVRNLKWNSTSFLINEKPIYFRGFGRHEDSDVRFYLN